MVSRGWKGKLYIYRVWGILNREVKKPMEDFLGCWTKGLQKGIRQPGQSISRRMQCQDAGKHITESIQFSIVFIVLLEYIEQLATAGEKSEHWQRTVAKAPNGNDERVMRKGAYYEGKNQNLGSWTPFQVLGVTLEGSLVIHRAQTTLTRCHFPVKRAFLWCCQHTVSAY